LITEGDIVTIDLDQLLRQPRVYTVAKVANTTVGDVINDRWPDGWEKATLYAFRDGETIFYVGKTVDIYTRLTEHVTGEWHGGWGGYRPLTELIADNLPDSLDWVIELCSTKDDLGDAEAAMIGTMRPVLNTMHNRNGKSLPDKYKTEVYKARQRKIEEAWRRPIAPDTDAL
jgi:hypothetical protein